MASVHYQIRSVPKSNLTLQTRNRVVNQIAPPETNIFGRISPREVKFSGCRTLKKVRGNKRGNIHSMLLVGRVVLVPGNCLTADAIDLQKVQRRFKI